jgi:hypothetical protein
MLICEVADEQEEKSARLGTSILTNNYSLQSF